MFEDIQNYVRNRSFFSDFLNNQKNQKLKFWLDIPGLVFKPRSFYTKYLLKSFQQFFPTKTLVIIAELIHTSEELFK